MAQSVISTRAKITLYGITIAWAGGQEGHRHQGLAMTEAHEGLEKVPRVL